MILHDYYEAREWLEQFIPQTYSKKNLGLERIRYLLKLLGNPEKKFKSILVGGTSGKGSTAYYLARGLQFSSQFTVHSSQTKNVSVNREQTTDNLKIGLHTSPHLTYIGERMQINGRPIAPNRLVELVNEVRPKVESMGNRKVGLPSYFEILVAVSFLYFAREKVDWAVVEVGLGGRLDATNILSSRMSIITNVGLDHTDILGKTIEKIAKEKAGIIKTREKGPFDQTQGKKGKREKLEQGVPVVTGASGKALEVIEKVAKSKKSPLMTIDLRNRKFRISDLSLDKLNTLKKSDRVYFDQLRNIKDNFDSDFGTKVYVTDECFFLVNLVLNQLGIKLSVNEQKKVFSARFAARFEEIDNGVLIDGAHNRDKARVLVNWVQNSQQVASNKRLVKKITLVCGFKKGKDWRSILKLLLKELDIERVITTQFVSPTDTGFFGSVEPEEIKKYLVSSIQYPVSRIKTFGNSQEAVFEAVNHPVVTPGVSKSRYTPGVLPDLVLITGSLYLAGEARTLWILPEF